MIAAPGNLFSYRLVRFFIDGIKRFAPMPEACRADHMILLNPELTPHCSGFFLSKICQRESGRLGGAVCPFK